MEKSFCDDDKYAEAQGKKAAVLEEQRISLAVWLSLLVQVLAIHRSAESAMIVDVSWSVSGSVEDAEEWV